VRGVGVSVSVCGGGVWVGCCGWGDERGATFKLQLNS